MRCRYDGGVSRAYVCFVDDLLFRSKIRAVAAHTGAAVTFARDAGDEALDEAALAIVDLDGATAITTLTRLRDLHPDLRIVGFVSHVHAERIREARATGGVEVLARSAFVQQLPDLLGGDK